MGRSREIHIIDHASLSRSGTSWDARDRLLVRSSPPFMLHTSSLTASLISEGTGTRLRKLATEQCEDYRKRARRHDERGVTSQLSALPVDGLELM